MSSGVSFNFKSTLIRSRSSSAVSCRSKWSSLIFWALLTNRRSLRHSRYLSGWWDVGIVPPCILANHDVRLGGHLDTKKPRLVTGIFAGRTPGNKEPQQLFVETVECHTTSIENLATCLGCSVAGTPGWVRKRILKLLSMHATFTHTFVGGAVGGRDYPVVGTV